MRRLCFLLPDIEHAHAVVDDLRDEGIKDADIYVVANEETKLRDLPGKGMIEGSDFYPQLERGLAIGGAIGAIGSMIAMRVAGVVLGGGAILLFGLLGAGFSGLLASIAGAAFPNSRLAQFQDAIDAGHVLVIVDLPPNQIPIIEKRVKARHPDVEFDGLEPRAPLIPHP